MKLYYTEITNKDAHAAAHLLLRHAVRQTPVAQGNVLLPDAFDMPRLVFGPHGKPALQDMPDLHFSLSHAGAYAVCVIAAVPVGVDVQDHRNITPARLNRLAARFFTPAESALISSASDADRIPLFYRIWAAKEAYVKYTGEGLAGDFSSFVTDLVSGEIHPVHQKGAAQHLPSAPVAHITEATPFVRHSLCVCAKERIASVELIPVTI